MKAKYLMMVLSSIPLWTLNVYADNSNPNINPWQLNVYTNQNLGTSNSPYAVDIQGSVGAGGNVYMQNYSVNQNGTSSSSSPYSIYAGGNVNLNSGSVNNGGIQAGGSITTSSSSVNGNVSSGSNLYGSGGTITGNATLGGTNQSNTTINGTVQQNQSSPVFLNQATVQNYFQSASSYYQSLNTTGSYTNSYTTLTLNNPVTNGQNVIDISLATWNSLTSINLSGLSSGAYVIFDITGATSNSTLKAVSINGVNLNQVLVNINQSINLSMSGGAYSSVLAPNANITFTSGVLVGNLIANNLYGNGQVNTGPFVGFANDQSNYIAAPEPVTYMILGSMLGLISFIKLRQKAKKPIA